MSRIRTRIPARVKRYAISPPIVPAPSTVTESMGSAAAADGMRFASSLMMKMNRRFTDSGVKRSFATAFSLDLEPVLQPRAVGGAEHA
jgi:hypothetical protein